MNKPRPVYDQNPDGTTRINATLDDCRDDLRWQQALDPKPPLPRGAEEDES